VTAHGITWESLLGSSPRHPRPQAPLRRPVPLYVDLDGTLVATDTLWESFLLFLAHRPLSAWRVPAWLVRGRAVFKHEIAQRVALPPESLPYRPEVLGLIAEARARGAEVILATAADEVLAQSVAEHVGQFDGVLASDGDANLKGARKLAAIRAHAGDRPFAYVGNDSTDIPILAAATVGFLTAASPALARLFTHRHPSVRLLGETTGNRRAMLRLIRPQQWVKNILVLVPLLLSHLVLELPRLASAISAMVAFSFCASAVYVVNDLLDVHADRLHPRKRRRPIAAGEVTIPQAALLALGLVVAALALAVTTLPITFVGVLALYFATSQAYSLVLKRIPVLDVIVLAGLYALRLLAGAVATGVSISAWLLAFALFFFLSLAYVKRYTELTLLRERGEGGSARRGYEVPDLELVRSVGPASGYLSVLVLALYTSSEAVRALYPHPQFLWLLGPILLFWISRVWLLAHRGQMHDDPIVFAVKDRTSYVVGALALAIGLAATFL
jgi:4-hydroxybenzoate polyprenyltransferase/phosphoserine phosphatase